MSFENFPAAQEQSPVDVKVEREYTDYVPSDFLDDPRGYFEREGKNIKDGEIKVDEQGRVREDPTAVKDFPVWKREDDQELLTVARRVNAVKGEVGNSGDPFYEYGILEKLQRMGLPAARPVAKAEQAGTHIIVMERIPGVRWSEKDAQSLKEKGFSDVEIDSLKTEAQRQMEELQQQFEVKGVKRGWKLSDMVLQVDTEHKRLVAIVPTDWERTTISEPSE